MRERNCQASIGSALNSLQIAADAGDLEEVGRLLHEAIEMFTADLRLHSPHRG